MDKVSRGLNDYLDALTQGIDILTVRDQVVDLERWVDKTDEYDLKQNYQNYRGLSEQLVALKAINPRDENAAVHEEVRDRIDRLMENLKARPGMVAYGTNMISSYQKVVTNLSGEAKKATSPKAKKELVEKLTNVRSSIQRENNHEVLKWLNVGVISPLILSLGGH